MIPVKVISRVEIEPIKEDVITKLLTAEMLRDNPNLVINSITYERKLTPSRMVAIVDAQMGGSGPKPATVQMEIPMELAPPPTDVPTKVVEDAEEEAPKSPRKKVFG